MEVLIITMVGGSEHGPHINSANVLLAKQAICQKQLQNHKHVCVQEKLKCSMLGLSAYSTILVTTLTSNPEYPTNVQSLPLGHCFYGFL